MSMFKDLMGKIFGKDEEEAPAPVTPTPVEPPAPITPPPVEAPAPAAEEEDKGILESVGDAVGDAVEAVKDAVVGEEAPAEEVVVEVAAPVPTPVSIVDVKAMLDGKADAHGEDLDWKRSIVDLLKLVDMDSSYGARKEMALELGYSQEDIDAKGSAEMNMWLHKQVLGEIAKNGGNIPDELLA